MREKLIRPRVQKVEKTKKNMGDETTGEHFKIVLIGESGSGKTSLLLRFADKVFNANSIATIFLDFKIMNLKVDGFPVKL